MVPVAESSVDTPKLVLCKILQRNSLMSSPWFAWISPKTYKAPPSEYGLPPLDEPF